MCIRLLRPDLFLPSVLGIEAKPLQKAGVKALLLDADNTLFPHNSATAPKRVLAKLSSLQKTFPLAVVTNSSSPEHRKKLRSYFSSKGIKLYVSTHNSKKPLKAPFLEASAALGVPPGKCAMAGDNLFTDIAGAKRCGMFAIKVPPVDTKSEPWYFCFMRLAETAVIALN